MRSFASQKTMDLLARWLRDAVAYTHSTAGRTKMRVETSKIKQITRLSVRQHHLGLLMNFNEVLLPNGLQRIIS
jgi:hypothetical protein